MTATENRTLLIWFNVGGSLRFLSHREGATMLERALVRAGVPIKFSTGFNPHPRLSLPLPRSVGVAAENDLACVLLEGEIDAGAVHSGLAAELPEGCELVRVEVRPGRISPHASRAVYVFPVGSLLEDKFLFDAVAGLQAALLEGGPVTVDRRNKKGRTVEKDISEFVGSVEVEGGQIAVETLITDGGSVRVDEILTLLGIEMKDLSGAVVRKDVSWDI